MTLKLTDLGPQFLRVKDERTFEYVDTIEEAQGISFLCPVCFQKNGGRRGTHLVLCWDLSVPGHIHPIPGRWDLKGTGYDDLSLVNGSSSILLKNGCKAHFFVKNGMIV